MTRNEEFLAYIAVMVGSQLAAAAAFHLRLRRGDEPPGPAPGPVCVLVPCMGEIPNLAAHARALLAQDHPDYEVVFVVPSREDAAWTALSPVVEGSARARLLAVGGPPPPSCSGKIADLLAALETVPARFAVLAFADADLRVRPDWLRRLVAPLSRPEAGATTSCALYVAADEGVFSFLRMAWLGVVVPYMGLFGAVIGHSFALRREDFAAFRIPEVWRRSLLEDLPVRDAVRRAGMKVVFVGGAVSASEEPCDARTYVHLLNKWVLLLRVYDPAMWLACLTAVFMHGWIVFWCLRPPVTLWLPALLLGGDALAAALQLWSYQRALPDRLAALHPRWRPLPLWAALAAPLLWLSYAFEVLCSIPATSVRWGGRTYRLRGPQDVEVVG